MRKQSEARVEPGQGPAVCGPALAPQPKEKPVLTVKEAAEQLGVSGRTVINIFEREAGTIIVARPETMHKRRYRSIRIPRAVFERVLRRLTV